MKTDWDRLADINDNWYYELDMEAEDESALEYAYWENFDD